jgi:hypothetical protein
MAASKEETKVEVKSAVKFPVGELVASARYAKDRDILSALLDNTKSYSFDEVDKIVEKFKKTRV